MNNEHDDTLVAAARQLSTEISPERDLWPGIAEHLEAPQRSRWAPMLAQAAAVLVLIAASSGITWYAVQEDPILVTEIRPELTVQQAAFGSRYTLGPEFFDARDSLEQGFDQALGRLSPEQREDVEASLMVIRKVIADINVELNKDPTNVYLQEILMKSYREELGLMQRVGGLTRNVMRRNDI